MAELCGTGIKRRSKGKKLRISSGALCALGFLSALSALLAFPGPVREGVWNSMTVCLTSVVPSLFPFMVLAGFGADSRAGENLDRWLGPAIRHIFRLPDCCAATLLMSFLGGYPAGAKGISLLLERGKIDERQARRMLLFCLSPGPAFTVTFVGSGLLGDLRAGWLLFAAVTGAGLLLGLLTAVGKPVPGRKQPRQESYPAGALIRSVHGAAKSVALMCACIMLFAAFTAVLRASGIFTFLCRGLDALLPSLRSGEVLLAFLLEVTDGTGKAAAAGAVPGLFAFGLGFGGLCVHFQVFSIAAGVPVKKPLFLLFRLLHGLLSAGAVYGLIRLFPGEPATAAPVATWAAVQAGAGVSPLSGTLAGGISLLLMCLAFLVITGEERQDL